MRKLIMSIAAIFLAVGLFTGCDSRKKTDSANRDTEVSEGNIDNQNTDMIDASGAEFRKFRLDAEDQIAETGREIAQIRKRIVTEGAAKRDNLEDRLQKIEKKNNDFKKELAEFKEDAADKRDNFKTRFNEDVTELKQEVRGFWADRVDNDKRNRMNDKDRDNDNNTPGK